MLEALVVDGGGSKRLALVDDQQGLVVSVLPCPPMVPQQNKVFRQYFTATGAAAGSNDMGIDGLVAKGYDEALVRRIVHAVELSEYKRRQSPPGVKITPKSFDRDRRMPIVNRYRN